MTNRLDAVILDEAGARRLELAVGDQQGVAEPAVRARPLREHRADHGDGGRDLDPGEGGGQRAGGLEEGEPAPARGVQRAQQLAGVAIQRLKTRVLNLGDRHSDIVRALDFLFSGV